MPDLGEADAEAYAAVAEHGVELEELADQAAVRIARVTASSLERTRLDPDRCKRRAVHQRQRGAVNADCPAPFHRGLRGSRLGAA
jgi:hypothetical protein